MKGLLHDLVFGARQLRRNAAVTWAAILCIALGIGGNTAVFSFFDALILRQAPVSDPDSLVRIFADWSDSSPYGALSYPDFKDLRQRDDIFADAMAEAPLPLHVSTVDRRERLWGSVVTPNYFSMLGVAPFLGGGFSSPAEPEDAAEAVISYGLWQGLFGGRQDILRQKIILNGHPFAIVGVAPSKFHGTNLGLAPALWIPMEMVDWVGAGRYERNSRGDHWLSFVTGRLQPDVNLHQAESALATFMEHLAERYPETNRGKTVRVIPERQAALHPEIRDSVLTLLGLLGAVVALILLLACANVAGLLLSRFSGRVREMSVRLALGASRLRLVRQLLCESLLLATLGGLAGLLGGVWLLDLFRSYRIPLDLPVFFEVSLNERLLLFSLLASLMTGLIFGIAPAIQTTRPNLGPSLRGRRSTPGRSGVHLQNYLVAAQISLSLILLIGAGLVLRSLQQAREINPGFDASNLLIASVDLDLQGYSEEEGKRFLAEFKEEIQNLPGVRGAGYAQLLPFSFLRNQTTILPEDYAPVESQDWPSVDLNIVGHDYFRAVGIPILSGRGFDAADGQETQPVAVVNQTLAERFWPGREAIGKRIQLGETLHQVVGIAADGKYHSLGEKPKPYLYLPLGQNYSGMANLHIRTSIDSLSLTEPVREVAARLDRTLPLAKLQTMEAQLGIALLPARLAAGVVSSFAVLALLLAAVGLYGTIAHLVTLRRGEIGIRKALGARPAEVLRFVLLRGIKLLAVGALIGLIAGAALAQLIGGLLYGVTAWDPIAYFIAIIPLVVTSLMASLLPAWKALKIDPAAALRNQ